MLASAKIEKLGYKCLFNYGMVFHPTIRHFMQKNKAPVKGNESSHFCRSKISVVAERIALASNLSKSRSVPYQ